jgi:hypothetical protein
MTAFTMIGATMSIGRATDVGPSNSVMEFHLVNSQSRFHHAPRIEAFLVIPPAPMMTRTFLERGWE